MFISLSRFSCINKLRSGCVFGLMLALAGCTTPQEKPATFTEVKQAVGEEIQASDRHGSEERHRLERDLQNKFQAVQKHLQVLEELAKNQKNMRMKEDIEDMTQFFKRDAFALEQKFKELRVKEKASHADDQKEINAQWEQLNQKMDELAYNIDTHPIRLKLEKPE